MSQQPHIVIPDVLPGAVEATVQGGAMDGANALVVNGRDMAFMVVAVPERGGFKVTCGLGRHAPPPHVIARIIRGIADNLDTETSS